jgi:hypothetical protein
MLPCSDRVRFKEAGFVAKNPVYVVVNTLEEGDCVMQVFTKAIDAYEFALQEAQYNEVDEYAIITKELH